MFVASSPNGACAELLAGGHSWGSVAIILDSPVLAPTERVTEVTELRWNLERVEPPSPDCGTLQPL